MSPGPSSPTEEIKSPPGGRLSKALYWLLGGFAALLLFAMMALTFVDVVGRYFFNAPVPGAFEITELMLATLIFAALPLVTIYGEQITVDLFDTFIPNTVRHLRDGVISALSAAALFVLSVSMWGKAAESSGYGDTTAMLNIPIAPMIYFMSVMLALTGVVLAVMAWWSLSGHEQAHSDKY